MNCSFNFLVCSSWPEPLCTASLRILSSLLNSANSELLQRGRGMKRRSSWSAMWWRAVISSWESAGWVSNWKSKMEEKWGRWQQTFQECWRSRRLLKSPTLHCIKGLSRTKIGIRVRTIKSMKSQKAKPPTFLRAISFTCRLSRYHWFPSERSKQTSTTFRAVEEGGWEEEDKAKL